MKNKLNGNTSWTTCEPFTCQDHLHPSILEQRDDYWDTPSGMRRRIRSLAQDFTYRIVNNAVKIYGQTNGAKWLYWLTVGDDRVCPICTKAAQGGRDGHYRVTWYTPAMPAHANCFLKDTLVDTLRGLTPIQDIQVGDYVLTHKNRYRMVRQTHKRNFIGKTYGLGNVWMTGDHPVFTPQGRIRIDNINDVSNILCILPYFDNESAINDFKNNPIPALPSQEPFLGGILLNSQSMPSANVNFNSYFFTGNSEIEVISKEGVFTNHIYSIIVENLKKIGFCSRHGFFYTPSERSNSMSISNLSMPLISSHLVPFKNFSVTPSTIINPTFDESTLDSISSNIKPFTELQNTNSCIIKTDDFINRKIFPNKNASILIPITKHPLTPINTIGTSMYKGFTYNLTVDEDESYTVGTQRIVVGNCRCQWIVYFEET